MRAARSLLLGWRPGVDATALGASFLAFQLSCTSLCFCSSAATGNKAPTVPRRKGLQPHEQQQRVEELHEHLADMGITQQQLARILSKRAWAGAPAALGLELRQRLEALLDVTQAASPGARAALLAKLYHSPELLHFTPSSLRAKAAALLDGAAALQLSREDAQQLISRQPAVLTFRTEGVAAKLAGMAAVLGLPVAAVQRLWVKQRTLLNLAPDSVAAKIDHIAQLLRLQRADVARLVAQQPSLLCSSADTLAARVEALAQCLNCVEPGQLGQLLLSHAAALTCSADSMRAKFGVLHSYGQLHPASAAQLAARAEAPGALLNLVLRGSQRYALLEYVIATRQRAAGAAQAARQPWQQEKQQQQQQQQQQPAASVGGDCSISAGSSGACIEAMLQDGLPLAPAILWCSSDRFQLLVDNYFPGFWAWQQQREARG